MGSTITGDLGGDFTMAPGNTNASGQFTIRGGTGPFAGAAGAGNFTSTVADPSAGPSMVTLTGPAISLGAVPAAAAGPFPGYLPPPSGSPAYVAPPIYPPAYVAPPVAPASYNAPGYNGLPGYSDPYYPPAYVAPPVAPANYNAPGYNGLPGYTDPNYAAAQAQAAAAQAAAQVAAAQAAAQAAPPQVVVVPIRESEFDPNGVFDRPARSSSTNRNYR
jgi:hypothetical protein